MSAAENYLLLGLRLGRHVDGLVDSYYGPAELKKQVDAEGLVPPAQLVEDAAALRNSLDDGYLRDLVNGSTACLSCNAVLGKGAASHPHLSADARFVVFAWQAERGRPSVSPRTDIVLLDRTLNATTVITKAANAASTRPRISGTGSPTRPKKSRKSRV